jgi:hypothetical protein
MVGIVRKYLRCLRVFGFRGVFLMPWRPVLLVSIHHGHAKRYQRRGTREMASMEGVGGNMTALLPVMTEGLPLCLVFGAVLIEVLFMYNFYWNLLVLVHYDVQSNSPP